MLKFKEYIIETLTKDNLDQIERFADKLFKKLKIDVEFTRHFLDRVNDARNGKPISSAELIHLFKNTHKKYGKKLSQSDPGLQAVIHDMANDVNMPFIMKWDANNNEWDMVAKTVMRKKDFKTSNQKFKV